MNFRVSDDVDELENYISLFDRIVDKEIDKTNKTILKEKDTPITRANDSRIKKIYANTEEVIKKNTDKLGEVLDTLDRIGETLRESGAPDADIIRIADLIGEGKDKLKVEKSVEVYKEKKEFKSNIDKKYSSMAGKWKKIRNNLPTVKIQELTEEIEKTEADLPPLRKQIGIEKRKKTNLENKVAELNADLEGKRDELTAVSAEVSARVEASDRMQNELKQQISELTEACKTFTDETDSMTAALNELKSDYTDTIEPLRNAREAESQTLRQLETELNSIKMEESVKQKKAEKAFLFKKRKQAEYDEVHGKATSKSNQVNSAKDKLAKLDLEIARTDSDWRGKITQAEKDLASKQTQLASAKDELSTTREKLSSEKERIKPDKDRLTAAKDSVKEAEALLAEKTKDLQTVTEQLSRDEETRDTGTARVDELKKQIRELNTAVKEDGKKTSQIVHVEEQTDVAQTPAPRSADDYGLSYSEGLVAHGSNYKIDIPDGFVIKKNAEGRAFIAYLPDEDEPDSIFMSSFVIYDGQDLGVGGNMSSLKVPPEYMSLMQQMSGMFGIVADNSRIERILRDDLPGGLLIAFDEGSIHVNALLAVANGFKMMRLQFNCKDESRYEEYVQISKEVFDHMTVDNPVVLLDRPDDSRFVSMKLASDSVAEWTALLDEYKEHLINARNTEQDSLVAVLQKKQGISLEDAKQEIRGMLVDHITYIDRVLCRAEALYVLKKAQYPDKKSELDTMAESLGKIVELTSQHANINGERIEYTSEFGKKVKKRMKDDTVAVARSILSESESMLTPELVDSLRKIAGDEDEGDEEDAVKKRETAVAILAVGGDPEVIASMMEEAAKAGDGMAQFNMGLFCAKGFGVDRDFDKMNEWMKKASANGDSDADAVLKEYGYMAEALKKAQKGDAEAAGKLAEGYMKLSMLFEQGDIEADYKESVKWGRKAVAKNDPRGTYVLALAYEHGRGVKADSKKALELYRQGADLGDDGCMLNLGTAYLTGEAVKKDSRKGFALIKKSAEAGNGRAMVNLARCYQFATGTKGNMTKALEWYEKASEVLDDPELDARVMAFRQLKEIDPGFDREYDEVDDEDESSGEGEDAYAALTAGMSNKDIRSGGNGKMNNSQCKECYWYDGKNLSKYPEACDRYEDIKSTVVVGSSSACPYFWSKADQEAFENGI